MGDAHERSYVVAVLATTYEPVAASASGCVPCGPRLHVAPLWRTSDFPETGATRANS